MEEWQKDADTRHDLQPPCPGDSRRNAANCLARGSLRKARGVPPDPLRNPGGKKPGLRCPLPRPCRPGTEFNLLPLSPDGGSSGVDLSRDHAPDPGETRRRIRHSLRHLPHRQSLAGCRRQQRLLRARPDLPHHSERESESATDSAHRFAHPSGMVAKALSRGDDEIHLRRQWRISLHLLAPLPAGRGGGPARSNPLLRKEFSRQHGGLSPHRRQHP